MIIGEILAQSKELEAVYPEIFGTTPKTVDFGIVEYGKYIFNFSIAIIGFIAFGALVYGGVRYLISQGKPEEIKKAQQQIKSAILGILLLLFSYLIVTTINPQLVVFDLKKLPVKSVSVQPPSKPPPFTPDPFARINSLSQKVKTTADSIKSPASEIGSLTSKCNCIRTQPLCLTKDYYGACESQFCYSASRDQPCPNIDEINRNKQRLIDLRDLILYYKNRARAEAQDLNDEVNKIIDKKIKFLEERKTSEQDIRNQCESQQCQELQKNIIDSLDDDIKKLKKEKKSKQQLSSALIELANTIEKIEEPATDLAALPDECLANVRKQCVGSCYGGGHDTWGCFRGFCSGGNPCPMGDIGTQVFKIRLIAEQIERKAEAIFSQTPISQTPGPPGPPGAACDDSQKQNLAQQNNVPYPATNAPATEQLLTIIKSKVKGNLGEISTFDKTYDICNYTRGTCRPCSHSRYSCHYGGQSGSEGALAIDFGNEKIGDQIIQVALNSGLAKSARCETNRGRTVACNNLTATHVHITVVGCDRN